MSKILTIAIPDDLYKKMKKYREIKWSEVARKAIEEYIRRLELSEKEMSSDKICEILGIDHSVFEKIPIKKAEKFARDLRNLEWKRSSTIQAS